jgi:hypothetical protein
MEIEQSSLFREITGIISSPVKPVHYTWAADIHVAGETIRALKVLSLDLDEDFENNYSDELLVNVIIPGGTYAKRIYPNKSKIEITLYRIPIMEASDVNDPESVLQAERYTATMIDEGNPVVEGGSGNSATEDALNLTSLYQITFQLVNKALEQLRLISVGGNFRNTTIEEVLKALMTTESKRIEVEGSRLPKGVDMVPASNTSQRAHVVIKQGFPLVQVPSYLQKHCGGVYSAGLGYYLKGDFWYVYPSYDTSRFNQADRTLTIINVPPNKFPNIERTYRKDGKNLVILATGEVQFRDDSEVMQLNQGNGVRFANANQFMNGFAKIENNRAMVSRSSNNNEFVVEHRPNGNNNVRMGSQPITANPFVEYSNLARRQGGILALEWQNSQPSLIYPGMAGKLLYLDKDEIKEVHGVLLKAHHYTQLRGQGLMETRYVSHSVLYFFTKRVRNEIQ